VNPAKPEGRVPPIAVTQSE